MTFQIWQNLLLGKLRTPIDSSFKFTTNYSISKKAVENKMTGNNGWFPSLVLSRVNSQHHIRKLSVSPVLTETHKTILMNLMTLSTSQYSEIRMRAQEKVEMALGYFPNAYIILTPHIIQILQQDPTVHHDAYKVSTKRIILSYSLHIGRIQLKLPRILVILPKQYYFSCCRI